LWYSNSRSYPELLHLQQTTGAAAKKSISAILLLISRAVLREKVENYLGSAISSAAGILRSPASALACLSALAQASR
jgi:hypothetical protein